MMIKKAKSKSEVTRGSRRRGVGLSDHQKRIMKRRRDEMGMSQAELGERIAELESLKDPVSQATISNLEKIDPQGVSSRVPSQASKHLRSIEQILGLPAGFLKPGKQPRALQSVQMPMRPEGEHGVDVSVAPVDISAGTAVAAPDMYTTMAIGARDLPVYSSSYGLDGATIVSVEAAEYMDRPARLVRVSRGYGIRLSAGYAMEPAYEAGDVVWINPLLVIVPNKDVVLRKQDEGGEVLIRRLIAETATEWTVRQHEPEHTYTLSKAEWPIAQRVLGRYNE